MTEAEQAICTAPKGKLRLVHVDPRDHWPSNEGDHNNIAGVRTALNGMMHAQREGYHVFDDQGHEVRI